MSHTIGAEVATPNGAKYVLQLCKHWSHKLETKVEGSTGTVTFPNAVATMTAGDTGIAIAIAGENRDDVQGLTDVVARHIDRFAFREAPLTYEWEWQDEVAG